MDMYCFLTHAGAHVHGGHKAVETEAAVLSGDVGALTTITDIWSVLTLINV